MSLPEEEHDLIQRIRDGNEAAWRECIARYSGRLQAFAVSRLGDEQAAEDIVQETFLGFLTSLPNYDQRRSLESFLFAIAAHKMIDVLRKSGRRPALTLSSPDDSQGGVSPPASRARMASSLARSREQHDREATLIAACLRTLVQQWMTRGEYTRLKCAELLFVQGVSNQEAARLLGLSEQDVANHKQYVLSKLKAVAIQDPACDRFS